MDAESTAASRPIPREAFDWYDEYAHGVIDRRTFLGRLAGLGALGFSMTALAGALLPDYARAQQVPVDDPDIKAGYTNFESPQGHGECLGYLVVPQALEGKGPAVLVVHENRGLNPYIEDVARRLAKRGFIALAPDALHPLGGYPGNDDQGRAMQAGMDKAKLQEDFIAAAKFLNGHDRVNGKLGAVGFCYGGYIVNLLAATVPDVLDAGVVFYGSPPAESLRENVKGPLMLHFAGLDSRINQTWPAYREVLDANGVTYTAYTYEDVNHGFHNDSTARYSEPEAELAWMRTLEFFNEYLN